MRSRTRAVWQSSCAAFCLLLAFSPDATLRALVLCVQATGTIKVFDNYLKALQYSVASKRIAVCGDTGFKVLTRNEGDFEVLVQVKKVVQQ